MSFKICSLLSRDIAKYIAPSVRKCFYSSVATNAQNKRDSHSENAAKEENVQSESSVNDQSTMKEFAEYRFVYPEFLPDPTFEFRNKVREKLERLDMLKRRSTLHIPEFYVGSVLSVTATDPYAPGKQNKFVGMCIQRTYAGTRATFTLRNVVDGNGIEIMYDLYNPTILAIEVLRLEKRLDEELFYLRDADPKYSTFPFDMEPVLLPKGEPVPVNPLKVKLKPFPWHIKWEQRDMKGIESTDAVDIKKKHLAERIRTPWEKYDLMKEYRRCIPEDDQVEIWHDLEAHKHKFYTRAHAWKRNLMKAPSKRSK